MKSITQQKKIVNWNEYNMGLKQRGSLTIWIPENIEKIWYAEKESRKGKPCIYSDTAIEFVLTIGKIYNQRLRQATGLVESIFQLLQIDLPVPDYTTISRRGDLEVTLNVNKTKEGIHLTLDSSGMKKYGEGEWKVRKHGYTKHRMWKKIHIGIDSDGEIRMGLLTENNVTDADGYLAMSSQEGARILSFRGDGAYDRRKIYEHLENKKCKEVLVPPQRNAKIWKHGNTKGEKHVRDENLREIRKTSRKRWKRESGYHRRSVVESTMYRLKTTFTHKIHGRKEENQQTEFRIMCRCMNEMMRLGMPRYENF